MKMAQLLLICSLLFCCTRIVDAQKAEPRKQSKTAATETEIRTFYDEYADDLRQHRREAIANRYDPRGVYFVGNGEKTLASFAAVKEQYLTKWTGPKSFAWKDLSIEVLSPTTAVVIGRFDWQTVTGETLSLSYTGVLIKHSGKWRIRVEDESAAPAKPSTQ